MRTCVMLGLVALTGCAGSRGSGVGHVDADILDQTRGTGVDSADLRAVSEKVISDLAQSPRLSTGGRVPVILFDTVRNDTAQYIDTGLFRAEILPRLIEHSGGRYRFIDRSSIGAERRRKRLGLVSATRFEPVRGADYILQGRIKEIVGDEDGTETRYVLYAFQLIDAESGEIVHSTSMRIKKGQRIGDIYL